jgi:hypothetical protein
VWPARATSASTTHDILTSQENVGGPTLKHQNGLAQDVLQEKADGLKTTITYQANVNTSNNKHAFHILRSELAIQHHQLQKQLQTQQQD